MNFSKTPEITAEWVVLGVWDLFKVSERTRCPRDLLQITESIRTAHRRVESPAECPYRWTCILAPMRMCGIRITGRVPGPKPTGGVIEPENYIFQAIFMPRLMADVRATSGVVCGQQ